MNYTNLVDQFRELARDILRLRWVSNIKDQIAGIEREIASYTKYNEGYTKDIARANYRLSKLEEANPDYADLKKKDEDEIKSCNESIEHNNRSIADLTKESAKVAEEIAKVESGELKVSAESLSAKAKELAEDWMKVQAGKVKVTA
jgi:chromosome segregation ATPase